ncbi:hypothetical protein [Pseudomonas schmalbachii]|uniref:Uncharacterized protein n=1 Tax=Pseudomonas schmalbachii TaxID=2816993 RepID=A0ABS3TKC1_9PSED|nr:hypothetical protein [Pseudomonas schmalbachii]MBO3274086.1 hypothetical protein [Pseudomonas schmalbachii]
MSKAEMQKIAEDGVFQVACAMEQLNWLRSTLHVLRDRLKQEGLLEHYAMLVSLAIYNIDDWHNCLDCNREELTSRITKASEE